jgi:DnaD/phage-associated family protein
MKEQAVDEIVSKAVTIGLFDLGVYSGYSVLTSYDMQNQYSYAARKRNRHKIRPEYDLSGVSDVNNLVNVGDNPATGVVLDDQSTHMYMNKDMHINNKQTDIPAREDAESVDGSGPSKAMLQWQELWGWPNAIAQEDLRQWISDFGDDLVTWVIQYAARKDVQARSADKYLDRVFVAYKDRGITTVEAAEAESNQHEEIAKANAPRPQRQYGRQKREEQTPDWAKPGYEQPKEHISPELQAQMDAQLAQIRARREQRQKESEQT